MKKTVVTAENINALIKYQKKQIEKIVKDMNQKHQDEIQAIYGGLKILEFTYKEEIERLNESNNKLRAENEALKKTTI